MPKKFKIVGRTSWTPRAKSFRHNRSKYGYTLKYGWQSLKKIHRGDFITK